MRLDLPQRPGPRPTTTPTNPHRQLDQRAPVALQDRLRDHALALPGVRRGPSVISVPGAVAFFLDRPPHPPAVPDLFGGEWGHIHPHDDGSLHLTVTSVLAEQLVRTGWGEHHVMVRAGLAPPILVMLYGPRDEHELAVTRSVVEAAYLAAGGARADAAGRPLAAGPVDVPSRVPRPLPRHGRGHHG